ncbi:MAG: hypothetical protein M1828_003525 [Chrysothrix sp. TS-e1954]|nr:MAG: hypothetical protein M1828_003525 [Chrysothrix sp. TS-e1954]
MSRADLYQAFASDLESRLVSRQADESIHFELRSHINTLNSGSVVIAASRCDEADRQATRLWNLSIRLRHSDDDSTTAGKRLVLLRAFAFLLLEQAQTNNTRTPYSNIRLFRVANKAAKSCLEQEELDMALIILQRAATYESALDRFSQNSTEGNLPLQQGLRLQAEYYGLRITLAWKQNRLEVAETMFSKVITTQAQEPKTSEGLADVLFEVGRDLLKRNDFYKASKWLEKAHDVLSRQEAEDLSQDGSELGLSILYHLVRAHLDNGTEPAIEKARSLLALMENDYEGKLSVSVLHLELLSKEKDYDVDQYANESNKEWIEKLLVTRLWLSLRDIADDNAVLSSFSNLFAVFCQKTRDCLGVSATHAAHTLIWKRIEALAKEKQFDNAISWCRLALHQALKDAGEANRAKLQRKLVLCAISKLDLSLARQTLNIMSENTRAAPLTVYLAFKIALQESDVATASECIEKLGKISGKDTTLLYACVLEAQQSGARKQALDALRHALSRLEEDPPSGVHVPAMLRCTARLLMSDLSSEDSESLPRSSEDLCSIFKQAASHVARSSTAATENESSVWNDSELAWFTRHSYNLALKYYDQWFPQHALQMIEACLIMLQQKGVQQDDNTRSRLIVCHSLAAHLSLKRARAEDITQDKLQHYLQVKNHARMFRKALLERNPNAPSSEDKDSYVQIARKIYRADFEATIHLKLWDEILSIINRLTEQDSGGQQTLCAFADVILGSEAPSEIIFSTLEHILTHLRTPTTHIHTKLQTPQIARYIRILYHISLSLSLSLPPHPQSTSKPPTKTDTLITTALSLASTTNPSDPYPAEEMEWLATTTFNRAVDAYGVGDEVECGKRGQQALELAGMVVGGDRDRGELRRVLVGRLGILGLEGLGE